MRNTNLCFPLWQRACALALLVTVVGCGTSGNELPDTDADGNPDGDADGDPDGDADGNPDGDADGDSDGDADGDADPDSSDGDDVDGDADAALPAPSSATIGPEGGSVSLDDGTTLTIPAGCVEEDTEFSLIPVERMPTPDDGAGIVTIGTAFVIEPTGRGLEPLTITMPSSLIPPGYSVDDVYLHRVDEVEPDLRILASVMVPERTDVEGADFEVVYISPSNFQPFVVTSDGSLPAGAGHAGGRPVRWSKIPYPSPVHRHCSAALGAGTLTKLGTTAAKLDARVRIKLAPRFLKRLRATWNILDSLLPAGETTPSVLMTDLMDSVERFQARSCLATYRSLGYYEDRMGLPVPTKTLEITVRWRECGADTGCTCAQPDEACTGKTFGEMHSGGVIMYFRPGEAVAGTVYGGYIPPGVEDGPWNAPPAAGTSQADHIWATYDGMDGVIAHELFHWVEERSNNIVGEAPQLYEGDLWPIGVLESSTSFMNIFTEGAAEHAAEQVFDDYNRECWSRPMLWACGLHKTACVEDADNQYRGSALWRYLDWNQEVPAERDAFVARALRLVNSRSPLPALKTSPTRLKRADLDGIVRAMQPKRKNYDFDAAVADFAAAMVFTHDFERGATPAESDRFTDARGQRLDETCARCIWSKATKCPLPAGAGDHTCVSDLDTVDDPSPPEFIPGNGAEVSAVPWVIGLEPYTARGLKISLDGAYFDPGAFQPYEDVRVKLHADTKEIGARLYRKESAEGAAERAKLFWSRNEISTKSASPSSVVIPYAWTALHEYYLVLVNHDPTAARNVTIRFEKAEPLGLLAAADGTPPAQSLARFHPITFAPVKVCSDGTPGPDLTSSMHPDAIDLRDGSYAVAYPYSREIRFFSQDDCSLARTTVFAAGEPGPAAFDTMVGPEYLIVGRRNPRDACDPGAITVIEIETGEAVASVATPLGVHDVVVVQGAHGDEAVATMRGDDDRCPNTRLAIVRLEPPFETGTPLPLELVDTPGINTGRHGRIARDVLRSWAAWVTEYDDEEPDIVGSGGRIGLLRANDHALRVVGPEDRSPSLSADFDRPVDVAVTTGASGVRAYFVTARASTRPYSTDCESAHGYCSSVRWVTWNGTDHVDFSGEMMVETSSVRGVAISPDDRTLFITRSEGGNVLVWDIGDGGFDRFEAHPATPTVPGVLFPTSFRVQ